MANRDFKNVKRMISNISEDTYEAAESGGGGDLSSMVPLPIISAAAGNLGINPIPFDKMHVYLGDGTEVEIIQANPEYYIGYVYIENKYLGSDIRITVDEGIGLGVSVDVTATDYFTGEGYNYHFDKNTREVYITGIGPYSIGILNQGGK